MKTAIVGIGNSLMKDDGVGVHVARALADLPLPIGVEVIDAGTDPDVAFDVEHAERVIVVDAARGGEAPGTVYRFRHGVDVDPDGERRMCHEVGFLQTLRDIATTGCGPDVLIIGVEPEALEWGCELSPRVGASVPRVVEIVQQELEQGFRRD
jgi:hydrogenase maturation protease